MTDNMLKSAIQNWGRFNNTSDSAIREAFIARTGKIEFNAESQWEINVEAKAYDMMLDSITWNYKYTRFPWIEHVIITKWR